MCKQECQTEYNHLITYCQRVCYFLKNTTIPCEYYLQQCVKYLSVCLSVPVKLLAIFYHKKSPNMILVNLNITFRNVIIFSPSFFLRAVFSACVFNLFWVSGNYLKSDKIVNTPNFFFFNVTTFLQVDLFIYCCSEFIFHMY